MRFQEVWLRGRRWLFDSRGQDLIEYALLSATIGFAGYLGLNFLTSAMNSTYDSWQSEETGIQNCLVVEVPCPEGDDDCVSTCASVGSSLLSP
jgi:hypothetical protein